MDGDTTLRRATNVVCFMPLPMGFLPAELDLAFEGIDAVAVAVGVVEVHDELAHAHLEGLGRRLLLGGGREVRHDRCYRARAREKNEPA